MTEAEWFACASPSSMVFALYDIGRERNFRRKFLLFTCACFQHGRTLEPDAVRAVAVLERSAEGQADAAALTEARAEFGHLGGPAWPLFADGIGITDPTWGGPFGWYHSAWQTAAAVAGGATKRKPGRQSRATKAKWEQTRAELKALVLCVFGNPFRPNAFTPEWRTDTVVSLAEQMYESRDFSAAPILADALQDAGCDSSDLLDHCRGPHTAHVRGCWVADLVLGKE